LSADDHVRSSGILILVGWVTRQQQDVIAYLQTENRVLRELLGEGRLRFTDAQRRRNGPDSIHRRPIRWNETGAQ
ncbi:MAG: hypothetical protein ACE5JM_10180, partial [Armatimonadota bacterium]